MHIMDDNHIDFFFKIVPPQECKHLWYAFLTTDEYGYCPADDWAMYCAGQEL